MAPFDFPYLARAEHSGEWSTLPQSHGIPVIGDKNRRDCLRIAGQQQLPPFLMDRRHFRGIGPRRPSLQVVQCLADHRVRTLDEQCGNPPMHGKRLLFTDCVHASTCLMFPAASSNPRRIKLKQRFFSRKKAQKSANWKSMRS
ncbi:MAG: hypothetical protein MUF86_15185 [Akkermansiaceae bacterium]|nr:hypothetical protein [Akkermansiaceae bacterium]MCU0778992.1 hypothetical protein [Akkermansiaceae bacterium]